MAETPLSAHDSTFPAGEQDTVGTFPAPLDPTGKVSCLLAPPQFPAFPITDVTNPIGD